MTPPFLIWQVFYSSPGSVADSPALAAASASGGPKRTGAILRLGGAGRDRAHSVDAHPAPAHMPNRPPPPVATAVLPEVPPAPPGTTAGLPAASPAHATYAAAGAAAGAHPSSGAPVSVHRGPPLGSPPEKGAVQARPPTRPPSFSLPLAFVHGSSPQ